MKLAKMVNFIKKNKLWILILFLALITRLYALPLNPVGVTHDEVHDLINAKSMAETFSQAPGTVAGIFTKNGYCSSNCVFGELGSFILVPWMMIFPLSLLWSKIPFVLASLGIVFFTGKLFENLSGKKSVGLVTGLLVAINPWAIHFGRSVYENLFSYCFYLAGLYFFTKEAPKKTNVHLGFFFSVLGFLSYFGAKPLFPFLVLLGIGYYFYKTNQKEIKFSLFIAGLAIATTLIYLLLLKSSTAGLRLTELNAGDKTITTVNTTTLVDTQRKVSLQIPLVRDIIINKYTVDENSYVYKYLGAFSPQYLFNQGEQSLDVFIISNHAYMYLIDFLFILLGIVATGSLAFVASAFLFLLTALIPIPSVVSDIGVTYALRAGLLFPILCGFSALGISYMYNKVDKKFKKLFIVGVSIIYVISFLNFAFLYAFKTPYEKNAGWFFYERELVHYLRLADETDRNIVVISQSPLDFMYEYAFFSGKYETSSQIQNFNSMLKTRDYKTNNIQVIQNCPSDLSKYDQKNTTFVVQQGIKCDIPSSNTKVHITEARDGGDKYLISNDTLCSGLPKEKYVYPRNLTDFSIENMNQKQFCSTWISDPDQ